MDGMAGIMTASAPEQARPEWADRAQELYAQDMWTAGELRMLALTQLPTDKKRIHVWMQREGVLVTESRENGGIVYRYNLYSMPGEIRRAIGTRLAPWAFPAFVVSASAPIRARTEDLRALDGLPPKQALRGAARAEMVRAYERWSRISGVVGNRGIARFTDLWVAGQIEAPEWLRQALPKFCAKSLGDWQRLFRDKGMRALAGDYKPRVAMLEIAAELGDIAVGLIAHFPHITSARVHEHLAGEAAKLGLQVPSPRSVARWLARWKTENALAFAQVVNPDAARSKFMPAFGDAGASAHGLNVVWEMDTTPNDLTLSDGKRWTIIGIIDVWSRDVVLRLVERNSGHAARLTFRQALLQLGVPKMLRTDNGSDLRNTETKAMLAALGIELPHMPVGRPDMKPFIERVFRTLQHDLVPLLPGYTGHNVAEAQALRSRIPFMRQLFSKGTAPELRMPPGQMQAWLDTWCEGYRKRTHASLKCSPAERRAAWSEPLRRIEDVRALDILLAPLAGGDGRRVVTKKGIKAEGGTYSAPQLGDLVGETVVCRMDPTDAGRIYVFDDRGAFVCVAEDWRLTGTNPQELAEAAKATWRATSKAGAGELREKSRRVDKGTLATELANRRAAAVVTPKVVPLRPAVQLHNTPALDEMGRAARADDAPIAPERSAADAMRAEFVAAQAARTLADASRNSVEADKQHRLSRARALRDAAATGASLTEADRLWFDAYRTGAEWRWACTVEGLDPATGSPRNTA